MLHLLGVQHPQLAKTTMGVMYPGNGHGAVVGEDLAETLPSSLVNDVAVAREQLRYLGVAIGVHGVSCIS